MTQRSNLEQAAYNWWLQHRPENWTEIDHLENPGINCTNQTDRKLAEEIAEFVADEQYTWGVAR